MITTTTAPYQLSQLRHVDLLALAFEAAAVPVGRAALALGSATRDELIEVVTQPEVLARLAERAPRRLATDGGPSFECGTGLHAPVCSGRNCDCECHR